MPMPQITPAMMPGRKKVRGLSRRTRGRSGIATHATSQGTNTCEIVAKTTHMFSHCHPRV